MRSVSAEEKARRAEHKKSHEERNAEKQGPSQGKAKEKDLGVKWFNTIFYPQNYTGHAVHYHGADGVLDRLRKPKITLFTPWGPRYSWQRRGTEIQQGDAEVLTLTHLADLFGQMTTHMPDKNWRWVFLAADLYGTRINGLPDAAVSEYFKSLQGWIAELIPRAEFHLWSEYDAEAEEERRTIQREGLDTLLPPYVISQAVKVSGKGAFTGSALAYLVERIAEARIVERRFSPVKVSGVYPHKDKCIDEPLRRLYLLPEHLHAPWK